MSPASAVSKLWIWSATFAMAPIAPLTAPTRFESASRRLGLMLGKLGAESVVVSAASIAASESAGEGGDGLGPCGADWVSSSMRTTSFHRRRPAPRARLEALDEARVLEDIAPGDGDALLVADEGDDLLGLREGVAGPALSVHEPALQLPRLVVVAEDVPRRRAAAARVADGLLADADLVANNRLLTRTPEGGAVARESERLLVAGELLEAPGACSRRAHRLAEKFGTYGLDLR